DAPPDRLIPRCLADRRTRLDDHLDRCRAVRACPGLAGACGGGDGRSGSRGNRNRHGSAAAGRDRARRTLPRTPGGREQAMKLQGTIPGAALGAALCASSGCATRNGPYTPQTESTRDPNRAQALTQRAAACMVKDPAKAESLLREALTADLYHGPA